MDTWTTQFNYLNSNHPFWAFVYGKVNTSWCALASRLTRPYTVYNIFMYIYSPGISLISLKGTLALSLVVPMHKKYTSKLVKIIESHLLISSGLFPSGVRWKLSLIGQYTTLSSKMPRVVSRKGPRLIICSTGGMLPKNFLQSSWWTSKQGVFIYSDHSIK